MIRAAAFACGYKNKLGVIGLRMYHRWLALPLARLDFDFQPRVEFPGRLYNARSRSASLPFSANREVDLIFGRRDPYHVGWSGSDG
jgi:hypothetical protein